MITGSWCHACVYHKALTFLSLKCKNDIQAISVVLTDPERQKHSRIVQNSSCKQVIYIQAQMAAAHLFSFIFCCHASLTFALWHFSSCGTLANISSVKQYQICLGLLSVMCIFVPECEQSRRISSSLSLVCVGGQMKERQSHMEGVFKKDVAQEFCVGLPG